MKRNTGKKGQEYFRRRLFGKQLQELFGTAADAVRAGSGCGAGDLQSRSLRAGSLCVVPKSENRQTNPCAEGQAGTHIAGEIGNEAAVGCTVTGLRHGDPKGIAGGIWDILEITRSRRTAPTLTVESWSFEIGIAVRIVDCWFASGG